ncbi:MAG: NADH-quinone oxidoreductase subunit A [bacterium]|nr:NADH-quinone oxidoreductase subunit A [bacterium]
MIGLSFVLGERRMGRVTGQPYESGMPPTGSARRNVDVRFYLVAMFFVIFDMESAFVFAWAVALRPAGWAGWTAMAVFIGLLGLILAWLWRAGALEWGGNNELQIPDYE